MAETSAPSSGQSEAFRMSGSDMALYGLLVCVWSTSWYPLKLQVGVVAPEVSLVWRFILASSLMFLILKVLKKPLWLPLKDHGRLALLGILMFSTNFVLFYYASVHLASGLLPVIFSTTSLINLGLGILLLGQRFDRRVAIGAVLGISGITCVFWPEITGATFNKGAFFSLFLALAGTLSFALGNILSASNQKKGIPVFTATAWCMAYGALWMAIVAVFRGQPFIVEWSADYIGSLLWLTITSSVIALLVYTTLIGRIGAARTGYATVLFPIFALVISTVLEGFEWHLLSFVGVALVLTGNVFVLSRRQSG